MFSRLDLYFCTIIKIQTSFVFSSYQAQVLSRSSLLLDATMDDLSCLGCGQTFQSERSLSSHESQCTASKEFTSDLFSKHHRLEKKRKKNKKQKHSHRRSSSPSPRPASLQVVQRSPAVVMDIDESNDNRDIIEVRSR